MHRSASRALMLACAFACAPLSIAVAEPAPIVYAGQGAQATSLGAAALAGGAPNSYGYGAQARRRQGAVIDIRRVNVNAEAASQARAQADSQSAPEAPARPVWLDQERLGPPYEANGRWYVPTPEPGYQQTGTASWYGPQFHGRRTANGEVFDQEGLTAAHPTLPLNSLVQVTNLANGREAIVRVTDRGPFVGERLIDLSHGAAVALGFEREGHANVHVRYLGPAPRRVSADGAPVPTPAPLEQGPASLLPPPAPPDQVNQEQVNLEQASPVQAPPAASGGYFVQVGAFADLANAQRVRQSAAVAGPVLVDIRPTASGELYRVRVGPWGTREEADAARRQLSALGYSESAVAVP